MGFVFADTRRLFEYCPTVNFRGLQQLPDLPLLDNRICFRADSRIHEQFFNISQPADLVVNQIFAFTASINPPCDLDVVRFDSKRTRRIRKKQADLSRGNRLPDRRTAEYHIGHLAGTKALHALLAKHPLDRVNHVAFPAAVWPYDCRNRIIEIKFRLVCEALKTIKYNFLESHLRPAFNVR